MLALLRHRFTQRTLFTVVFELVSLNLGIGALLYARAEYWADPNPSPLLVVFALAVSGISQFFLWSLGLYSRRVIYTGSKVTVRLAWCLVCLAVALFPLCFLFSLLDPVFTVTFKFYVYVMVLFAVVVGVERWMVLLLFRGKHDFGDTLVLGTGPATTLLIEEVKRQHRGSLHFLGILAESESEVGTVVRGVPVLGTLKDLRTRLQNGNVRTVLIGVGPDHEQIPVEFLVECQFEGVEVCQLDSFYERLSQKTLLEALTPAAFLVAANNRASLVTRVGKAVIDRACAGFLLAALAVPLAVIMLLVKLTSPGPIFYLQERVGRKGQTFTIFKFRTMCDDAEAETGPAFCAQSDSRVTWIGNWLRRTRVDELPQLVNILRGEMSFVGPRPERPEFVRDLGRQLPCYSFRHFVKPGLSGWAQVCYPYARSLQDVREKLRYDLYYVGHVSVFFDLIIVLCTVRAVVRGAGLTRTGKESSGGPGTINSEINKSSPARGSDSRPVRSAC